MDDATKEIYNAELVELDKRREELDRLPPSEARTKELERIRARKGVISRMMSPEGKRLKRRAETERLRRQKKPKKAGDGWKCKCIML